MREKLTPFHDHRAFLCPILMIALGGNGSRNGACFFPFECLLIPLGNECPVGVCIVEKREEGTVNRHKMICYALKYGLLIVIPKYLLWTGSLFMVGQVERKEGKKQREEEVMFEK